jgi:hypothetical protein
VCACHTEAHLSCSKQPLSSNPLPCGPSRVPHSPTSPAMVLFSARAPSILNPSVGFDKTGKANCITLLVQLDRTVTSCRWNIRILTSQETQHKSGRVANKTTIVDGMNRSRSPYRLYSLQYSVCAFDRHLATSGQSNEKPPSADAK